MTRFGRLRSTVWAIETWVPPEGSGPWSGRLSGRVSGPGLLTRECLFTKEQVSAKDYRELRDGQGEIQAAGLARPVRFQDRYPGTPIRTIKAPQNASVGLWIMVLSVQT